MRRKGTKLLLVGAAFLTLTAACSSSSKSSGGSSSPTSGGGSSSSGGGKTYTVGVLTDLTGPAATNAFTIPKGVQAGIGQAATEGYTSSTSWPTRARRRRAR